MTSSTSHFSISVTECFDAAVTEVANSYEFTGNHYNVNRLKFYTGKVTFTSIGTSGWTSDQKSECETGTGGDKSFE
jgi:hypothetical protein